MSERGPGEQPCSELMIPSHAMPQATADRHSRYHGANPCKPEINRARRHCVLLNFAAPRAAVIRTLNDFGQRIEFGRCL
jgi:hypothetical protein